MPLCSQDSLIEAWSARLQLEPEAVARLLSLQPALLELTATTLKARRGNEGARREGGKLGLSHSQSLNHQGR